ncbi:MAG: tRNA (adenine(22)-N(1))-methyltransferase TrmK [Chloroflexota bacterium]
MKIGHRLKQIEQMIDEGYEHIWDCCCDHGLLGMTLLARQAARHIHFVDIVPQLMAALEMKLQQCFPPSSDCSRWHIHCTDVAQLNLGNDPLLRRKELVIIAGVGGDKVIEFVEALIGRQPNQGIEFLLCPIHHNYQVREVLSAHGFGLINEKLVTENKRSYEILHVSRTANQLLSLVGSVMWDLTRCDHLDYLRKTIDHYQRKIQNNDMETVKILAAYQRLHNLAKTV